MSAQSLADWIGNFIALAEQVVETERAALAAEHRGEAMRWMQRVDLHCRDCPQRNGCQPIIVEAAFEAVGSH